jgi:hypothetical protein
MKKFTLAALTMLTLAASCTKEETPATTTPTTPASSSPTAPSPTPSGGDISGALISIKMAYKVVQSGFEVPVNTEIGTAVFYSAPGSATMVDAGTVSVNTYSLDKAANNSYTKMGTMGLTPADLDLDGGSNWSVGGSGSVPAFTYNHTSSFPDYSGTVPTSVTKSSGLSMSFTSSNLSGADSVYVVVIGGSVTVTKSFAANAGTVTISASDLSGLPTITDNKGMIEVCPFKYTFHTTGGKKYVAIKEQAIVKNININ